MLGGPSNSSWWPTYPKLPLTLNWSWGLANSAVSSWRDWLNEKMRDGATTYCSPTIRISHPWFFVGPWVLPLHDSFIFER